MITKKLNIGIIGCGEWGPNHIRTLSSIEGCTVRIAADLSNQRRQVIQRQFPGITTTENSEKVINTKDLDAVVVATPTRTHYALAKQALEAGKHVLCEKPVTISSSEAEELNKLAQDNDLTLMVGHVFMYNPGILYLREQIISGVLGSIYYVDAVRTNLGPIRHDVGAILDLASHDISIFNFLLDSEPEQVSAHGGYYTQTDREDMAYLTLKFPNHKIGHAHVSWLNPRKVRKLTVVGDKKMAVWDDMTPLETIRIYDKGFHEPHYDTFGEFQIGLRDADITIPKLQMFEPLRKQAEDFVKCIHDGRQPVSNGNTGLSVVKVLEAAMQSLNNGSQFVPLGGNGHLESLHSSQKLDLESHGN